MEKTNGWLHKAKLVAKCFFKQIFKLMGAIFFLFFGKSEVDEKLDRARQEAEIKYPRHIC